MSFFKNVKKGVIYGGLVGALAGSQYGSVREAYEEVLEADIKQKETVLDYFKDSKDDFVDRETYKAKIEEIKEEYDAAKEKLEEYEQMDDSGQKKEALTDVKNYGLTFEQMEIGLNKDSAKGAKKGAAAGAIGGTVLLVGTGAMRKRKKRLKEKRNLESRLSIFFGLLAGGVGLSLVFSNFSGVVTGNVIKSGSYQTSGIIGIVLLVAGCVGSYFYFKE